MAVIANERAVLADSLWTATAKPSPTRPPLSDEAEADCVVIGGGFTGLSAALHLAERGVDVVLLEAETPGWGASGRNGGQVNPGLKAKPAELEARFGADHGRRMAALSGGAGDLVFDLIERHGIACDATRCGWLRAACSPAALADLRDAGRQWRARGHAVDDVDAAEMARLVGAGLYLGGVIDRRGGNLHPLNYALGLADAAERYGARIHGDSRATDIRSDDDGVTVSTADGHVTARSALVWTAPGMQGIFADILVVPDLQSCIRPVRAVDPTAGLDGFR